MPDDHGTRWENLLEEGTSEGRTLFSGLESLARRREMLLSLFDYGPNALDIEVQRYTSPTTAIIEGRPFVMMGSNNYLGISFMDRCREAAADAAADFGVGTTASRVASGTTAKHDALEREIAHALGKQHAIVFSTGFQSNLGVLAGLTGPGDVLLIDSDCHASIYEAAARSAARKVKFRHNDVAHLRSRLEELDTPYSRVLIVTESIFSALGDAAPLEEIVALKREFGCYLFLDEAHSFGLYGPEGAGYAHELGLADDIDIFMVTFSKALGVIGGAVVCNHPDFRTLKYAARSFLFTAALPPMIVSAALAGLAILREHPELRTALWANVTGFRERVSALGIPINDNVSPIVTGIMPDMEKGYRVWRHLYDSGVYANALLPPATPPNTHVIRFSISAQHSAEELDQVADILEECVTLFPDIAVRQPARADA